MAKKFNSMEYEILVRLHTKQLLKELRKTYNYWDYDWTIEDDAELLEYQNTIKSILATREHVPNKQESKIIRRLKAKKGI